MMIKNDWIPPRMLIPLLIIAVAVGIGSVAKDLIYARELMYIRKILETKSIVILDHLPKITSEE